MKKQIPSTEPQCIEVSSPSYFIGPLLGC